LTGDPSYKQEFGAIPDVNAIEILPFPHFIKYARIVTEDPCLLGYDSL
jgi:hypothetical protein